MKNGQTMACRELEERGSDLVSSTVTAFALSFAVLQVSQALSLHSPVRHSNRISKLNIQIAYPNRMYLEICIPSLTVRIVLFNYFFY